MRCSLRCFENVCTILTQLSLILFAWLSSDFPWIGVSDLNKQVFSVVLCIMRFYNDFICLWKNLNRHYFVLSALILNLFFLLFFFFFVSFFKNVVVDGWWSSSSKQCLFFSWMCISIVKLKRVVCTLSFLLVNF